MRGGRAQGVEKEFAGRKRMEMEAEEKDEDSGIEDGEMVMMADADTV